MYRHLYGLTHKPFQISTDPAFLWLGGKHKEALAVLVYGVRDSRGFLLLSGGVGTGKTTLIRSLLSQLDTNVVVATVQDPGLTPMEFFNFIAAAYGMRRRYTNKVDFLFDFEKFLRKTRDAGRTALLIVDEAQRLDQTLLEEIRLLSNIEDPDQKLLNVFFVGQEEFLNTISAPENRALKQRITINYHLRPLNPEETEQLVRHRLKVAGATRDVFTADAFPLIHRFSQGAPRLINILCDHALLTGFVKDADVIGADIIAECIEDLMLPGEHPRDWPSLPPEAPPPTPAPPRPVAATVTAGMMLQDRPPPAPRPQWPWAAAAGLLLAILLGISVQRGWLPLSDPPITARVAPATVARPSPPGEAPGAATAAAPAAAPPGIQTDWHPPPEAAPQRTEIPAGANTPPATGPAQAGPLNAPRAEEPAPPPKTASAPALPGGPLEEEPLIGHEVPDPLPPDPATVAKTVEDAVPAAPAPPAAAVKMERPAAEGAERGPQDGKTSESASAPQENAPATVASAPPGTQAHAPSMGAPPASAPPGAEPSRARPSEAPTPPVEERGPASPGSGSPAAARDAAPPSPLAALENPSPTDSEVWRDAPAAAGPPAESPEPSAVPPYPTEDRLRDFLSAYCRAYESLDLGRFRLFFAEDAEEAGRPFSTLLPVYRKNFAALEDLEYAIDLMSWEEDRTSGRITLSGVFDIRYRMPDQDWRTTQGEITMDLVPSGGAYRIRRLGYRKE